MWARSMIHQLHPPHQFFCFTFVNVCFVVTQEAFSRGLVPLSRQTCRQLPAETWWELSCFDPSSLSYCCTCRDPCATPPASAPENKGWNKNLWHCDFKNLINWWAFMTLVFVWALVSVILTYGTFLKSYLYHCINNKVLDTWEHEIPPPGHIHKQEVNTNIYFPLQKEVENISSRLQSKMKKAASIWF